MTSDTIELLKVELKKANGGALRPASHDEIEQAKLFGFPKVLLDFYVENAPDPALPCVALDQRIWTVENAIAENRDYVPGAELFPLGFVVFSSNRYGDAYCVDTVNPGHNGEYPIALFPHDVIEEGSTLENVAKYRLVVAVDFEDFLRQFTARTLVESPKYE
jgi:hypothetical protein